VQLHTSTQQMLEDVADGVSLLAFNVLGSYAEAFARGRSELGIVYPGDYTLVVSRVAFIAQRAPNPQGARAWLDYLLSIPGQRLMAEAGGLHAVRADAMPERPAASLQQRLGATARPVALGPGLLAHLDHSKRAAMVRRWRQALGQNLAAAPPEPRR
jgi:iron(III) transport system substrate-binding protein